MKKILIIALLTMICKCINAQTINDTLTHTDSINIQLMETIYANRNSYISYPMSKLYADIPQSIRFSEPDNVGISRGYGRAHYQNFIIYLPSGINDINYGFFITIASKVYIRVKDYFDKKDLNERYNYVKELLKNAIITGIEKND